MGDRGQKGRILRPAVDIEEVREKLPDERVTQWVRTLAKIHTSQKELVYGVYQELYLTNRQYAFARILRDNCVLVAVNNDEQEATVRVTVPTGAHPCQDLVSGEAVVCDDGQLELHLKPCDSRIFLCGPAVRE